MMTTSAYKAKQIGRVCEFKVEEVLSRTIEDLIDQGKRFTIVSDNEKGVQEDDS